ncbi:MAG: hypothetical protein ACKO2O_05315, partial [Crocinitomicaceae bacterium]
MKKKINCIFERLPKKFLENKSQLKFKIMRRILSIFIIPLVLISCKEKEKESDLDRTEVIKLIAIKDSLNLRGVDLRGVDLSEL